MKWLYQGIAIIAEIFATSALKSSDGFSRLAPSIITVFAVSYTHLTLPTNREV